MEWIDIDQNTDDWMELRSGRIGGSSIGKIMANYGKAFGEPAHTEALRIALEKIKGSQGCDGYSNEHMDRGHEQEPIARSIYEDVTFCDVSNGGYYTDGEYIGVSPDGLVGEDGLIEIKCVLPHIHFATIKRGAYDPKYKWQLCLNLKTSGREWIDYVEFCSDFPEGKKLSVFRYTKDHFYEMNEMIEQRMSEFISLIGEKINVIRKL